MMPVPTQAPSFAMSTSLGASFAQRAAKSLRLRIKEAATADRQLATVDVERLCRLRAPSLWFSGWFQQQSARRPPRPSPRHQRRNMPQEERPRMRECSGVPALYRQDFPRPQCRRTRRPSIRSGCNQRRPCPGRPSAALAQAQSQSPRPSARVSLPPAEVMVLWVACLRRSSRNAALQSARQSVTGAGAATATPAGCVQGRGRVAAENAVLTGVGGAAQAPALKSVKKPGTAVK